MSEKKNNFEGLKPFIRESTGSLIITFVLGFLVWDVFSHLLVDGMLPGQGSQGDVAGMFSPFFIIISAAALASSIKEEYDTWQTAVFHLLYAFGTILIHFLLSFLVYGLSKIINPWYEIGDIVFLVVILFIPFAMCYAVFRMCSLSLSGKQGAYMGVIIGAFVLMYFPIFMLVQAAGL